MNGIDLTHEEFLAAVAKHGVEPWMLMHSIMPTDRAQRSFVGLTHEMGYLRAYAAMRKVADAFVVLNPATNACVFSEAFDLLRERAVPGDPATRFLHVFKENRDTLARFLADEVLYSKAARAQRRKWRKAA